MTYLTDFTANRVRIEEPALSLRVKADVDSGWIRDQRCLTEQVHYEESAFRMNNCCSLSVFDSQRLIPVVHEHNIHLSCHSFWREDVALNEKSSAFLERLSNCFGPSGFEREPTRMLRHLRG